MPFCLKKATRVHQVATIIVMCFCSGWFDSFTTLRQLAIVAISAFVDDVVVACMAVLLLLMVSFVVTVRWKPYVIAKSGEVTAHALAACLVVCAAPV